MKVKVSFKSRIETIDSDSVSDLKTQVSKKFKLPIERLGLKDGNRLLTDTDTLVESVNLKDFGHQISWKLVFILEYLGPLLIHPLIYYIFGNDNPRARLVLILNVFHYLKREFESLSIHRFSHSTMPWKNLPKNCIHYWIFGGLCISLSVYSSSFSPWWTLSKGYTDLCLFIWCWAQISNLKTHVTLRDLRPLGSRERRIPFGYGFNLVSCPNYLFEIISWTMMTLLSGSIWVFLFTVIGAFQMASWALKKHDAYLTEFPEYPKNRTPIIPLLPLPRSRVKKQT